ncbi:hypothetical protein O6H91_15G054500 [Diphasiastrum complanatum]|uniref:Uncharacterized protein n=1 Tax=Diphasiastrum complanatum TaxID=34168 RepID=A0ACC2BI95_DIPCM|nr:hypothetical protein O6H91_15G054500 [Diphasiastrum complanatum]
MLDGRHVITKLPVRTLVLIRYNLQNVKCKKNTQIDTSWISHILPGTAGVPGWNRLTQAGPTIHSVHFLCERFNNLLRQFTKLNTHKIKEGDGYTLVASMAKKKPSNLHGTTRL